MFDICYALVTERKTFVISRADIDTQPSNANLTNTNINRIDQLEQNFP